MWDLSCPDWEERIRTGRSLIPDLPLHRAEADLACEFFDNIRLSDVPGTPLLRDGAGPWFRQIVEVLFGSRNPESNIRFIPEILLMVPKGSSKTSYGAALMLVALLMNMRPRAEFLFVAVTQAIADFAFSQAAGSVALDKQLDVRFHAIDHRKEIVDRTNGAKLKIKTFSLDVLTGLKPSGVMLDEVHLLAKMSAAGRILRQIRGGLEKMSEGFLMMTTTQSDERPAGVFREELILARKIRDGKFKGRMLPVLYEFPRDIASDETKWRDPANWHMVLPNLGRSLRLDSLEESLRTDVEKGETTIQVWASQHLNIEIGVSLLIDGWPGVEYWEAQGDSDLTLDAIKARCDLIVAGVDGGGLDDLLGLGVVGRERETGRWLHWAHAWAHVGVKERRKEIVAALEDFEKAGNLTFVKQMKQAHEECADIIADLDATGLLGPIGFDPAGASGVEKALAERDIEGEDRIIGVRQGYSLAGPVKDTETKLADGDLIHAGQPLMAWCAGNAKIEQIKNGYIVTKQASGTAKIDPLMALFNCAAVMRSNPESAGIYSGRDLLMIG